MGTKTNNTNYDILDKILAESDQAVRNGRRDRVNPQGVELTPEQLAAISKEADDIEKYLRS